MTVIIVVYCFQVLPLTVGGWPSAEGLRPSDTIETLRGIRDKEGADAMSVLELMAVLVYTATIFSIGYMLGCNANKQK